MDGTVIAALITGPLSFAGGIIAIVLTQRGSKKRDHEADWRKMKLEYYKEFFAAFSRVARTGSDSTEQQRYADAESNLLLVASPNVMKSLKAFQDARDSEDFKRESNKMERVLCSLMRTMREDCHPEPPNDDPDFIFLRVIPQPDNAKTKRTDAIEVRGKA